jgi:hypothetical protein
VKTEIIDRIDRESEEYSKLNFGLIGAKFPEIAKALIESDRFVTRAFVGSTVICISAPSLIEGLIGAPSKDLHYLRQALRGTPAERILLEMFYWGFECGRQSAEVDALNRLAQPGSDK